ncbi:UNVERIFIED_ORG: ribosome-associated heat shock protein Hsp15 [Pseudomonas fluorescens]|nr:ribosome-associated heat shock protein Hsp15 [Pseudomonas fluorescens]
MRPTESVVQFRLLAERGIHMAQKSEEDDKVRLDKWLWAARFFKTRALAKAAIESGKVHCRGERCKPGKEPRIGDEFEIRAGFDEKTVVVQALSIVRRGAPEAQTLYAETEASIAKREAAAAMRKAGALGVTTDGKPSKKQRRDLFKFRGNSSGE